MQRTPIVQTVALTAALVAGLASTACSRGTDQEKTPVAEMQTQSSVQRANTPMTVAGCLRAGEAADTFVLTVSEQPGQAGAATAGTGQAGTYQLAGSPNVDFRSHTGQRVEVSGTLRAQAEVASRTTPAPADQKPTGTSGTPTVQTSTEVAIKQLDVSAIKALGDRCEG